MSNQKGIFRKNYEDWQDLLRKLDALSSTVRTIQHAMEMEQIPEHIIHTYTTIDDAILGIIRFALGNVISSAFEAEEEKESIPSASHE